MQENNHSIQIDNRKSVTVTGVEAVKTFSRVRMELTLTATKSTLILTGEDFKITGFSKESGTFRASGIVDALKYSSSLSTRLFR